MTEAPAIRDMILAELRIAHLRARSAQEEIAFICRAYRDGILSTEEILEALNELGWSGFLTPSVMVKIREACGADVG